MKMTLIACAVTCLLSSATAQVAFDQNYPLTLHKGMASLSYQWLTLPDHEGHMGLAGLDYRIKLSGISYGGVGVDTAIKGDQGGLFILGLEWGVLPHLYGPVSLDAGAYVGAGGGSDNSLHSAILLNPHIGLLWNAGPVDLGIGYSWAKFVASDIDSHQWKFTVGVPLNIRTSSPTLAGVTVDDPSQNQFPGASPYAATHQLSFISELYFPMSGTQDREGAIQDKAITLLGAEFKTGLHETLYGFLKALTAVHGTQSGYKQVITGLGLKIPVINDVSLLSQVGVGAGGGGEVNTGGGFLFNPSLTLQIPLTQTWDLGVGGGYIYAPNGHFNAWTGNFSIGYRLHTGGLNRLEDNAEFSSVTFHAWQLSLGDEHLFSVKDMEDCSHGTDLVLMQANYFPTQHGYFAMNIGSSYKTRDAGFQVALLGAGVSYPVTSISPIDFYGEAFVGAAGGGDIQTADDAVYQADLGARWHLTPAFSVSGDVGRLESFRKSGVGSNIAALSLTYSLTQMEGEG